MTDLTKAPAKKSPWDRAADLSAWAGVGLGIAALLFAIVAAVLGVWHSDSRWGETAAISLVGGFFLALALIGLASLLEADK